MRVAAGFCSVILGLGFGLPCAFGIRHLVRTGEIWTFMGFPTYGNGPFERIGLPTSIPLLSTFLVVCVAEVVVGIAIWADAPGADVLAVALLPFELVFWIGFALPFGLIRTAIVLLT